LKVLTESYKPDYLFIDCEYYRNTTENLEILKSWKKGWNKLTDNGRKPIKQALTEIGNRVSRDVEFTINKNKEDTSSWVMIGWLNSMFEGKDDKDNSRTQFGFYGTGKWLDSKTERFPGNEMYEGIFNIVDIMKKNLNDFAQPETYNSGDMEFLISRIASTKKAIDSNRILPWCDAGYPTPFKREMVRDQLLELCAFGCRGGIYLRYDSWDPGAYLYQVYAINELAPFEDIFMDGTFYEQDKKQNKTAHVKGQKLGNEALILFSCYKRFKPVIEKVKNPLDKDCSVYDATTLKKLTDLKAGETIPVSLNMDRDTKLLYFGNKEDWEKRVK